jgi:hypothetical protein
VGHLAASVGAAVGIVNALNLVFMLYKWRNRK